MSEPSLTAEAFADAVIRLSWLRLEPPVVVKLGGSAMEDPTATNACLKSVAALNRLGVPLVLVHGGGKPIDRAMAEAGLTPKKVAGRRYTDAATLDIVVRVLKDQINTGLEAKLHDFGARAFATPGALDGERLLLPNPGGDPIDLGHVGRVTKVDTGFLGGFLMAHEIPVIPSLAKAADGSWLNINADTAASAVAGALKAEKVVFLTDTPGVLRDRSDPASLIPRLTEAEARGLIASGVIDGGMVPKVEACFEALAAGANSAFILDGRVPFSLLDVFLRDAPTGTVITR